MTPLTDDQKHLLFDYSLGLTSERETADAERLLSSSQEAARIHLSFKTALSPLDSSELARCPDDLAERTILRLKEQARGDSGRDRLEALLAAEQSAAGVTIRVPFFSQLG